MANSSSTTPDPAASSVITVGRTTIELLGRDGRLLGFGTIAVDGVKLRSSAVPFRPEIETPDGIRYDTFRLDDVRTENGEVVLVTTAFGVQALYGEYRDEYDSPLAWPRVPPGEICDLVEWRLRPETITLDDVAYAGFSYAFRFRSESRAVHRLTVVGTWELGARATGNTLLYQGQVNPPVHICTPDSSFTTACWRTLSRPGQPDNYSFQFSSRYSPHQCCDFQYGPRGSLLGYWPDVVDVHSLVQKNGGEDVVFVLDKCLRPLATDVTFARKHILWAPVPAEGVAEHLMHDRWLAALQHAQGRVRAAFGVPAPYVLPEATTPYGTGLDAQGKLVMRVRGRDVPPHRVLAAWAEQFPALRDLGIRRLFPEVVAESDITENGYTYKLMTGIHGDLVTSSVCNVWRYRPAELWGGWAAWEDFYAAGTAAGLEIGHWIGMHLSPLAPILQQHPEFVCRGVNTRPHGGGYTINLCCGLNWNTAHDWLLEQFAEWKRHGLDYLFFDSIGNMGFQGVDFSAGMQPNAEAIVRFIGGLGRLGIRAISVEGISPVGVGHFGMSDNMTENRRAPDAVAGQNDWSWWVGHEDMLVDTTPCAVPHPARSPQELHEQGFRALANRALLIFNDNSQAPSWPENLGRWSFFYRTFNTLQPLMQRRRLLPEHRGVCWHSPAGDALFAYQAFAFPLPAGARVERVVGEECTPVAGAGGVLQTEPWTAYRITGQGA